MTSSLLLWGAVLTIGISTLVISAGSGTPQVYAVVTACISAAVAALGVKSLAAAGTSGKSRATTSAIGARFMGLVWCWGALALLVTYYFILPSWREWPVFFGAFAVVAALCLMFAKALDSDAAKGVADETLLKLGRYLTIAQLVGSLIAVAGLLIDPDKQFLSPVKRDWAAVNIFFYGALAIATLSAAALHYTRPR